MKFVTLSSIGTSIMLSASGCQQTTRERPNIIYLFTDQQTAAAMSCAGNPYLHTPGMDKIAAMGVRFEQCYSTQPLCGPNRTVMFTGLYPHQTGAIMNMSQQSNKVGDNLMLGRALKNAGYATAYYGKWHIASSTEDQGQHGFDDIWADGVHTYKDYDDRVAERVLAFAKKDHQTPFFVVGSFNNPHNVCELARGLKNMETDFPNYDLPAYPDPKDCPPLPENFYPSVNEPDILRKIHGDPNNWIHYPTAEWSEDEWRQYLYVYYRMVEHVDQSVLKIVNGLEEAGLLENTLIIFTSDHGEGVAQHHWNQKQVLYESSVHIPFIMALKGETEPGSVNSALISIGLDLFPTICDYSNVSLSSHYFGKSIRPLVTGKQDKIHDFIVMETVFARGTREYGLRGRSLRTPGYKYIVYSAGELREQLFDMNNDPWEMNNLVVNVSSKKILQEHRTLLLKWGEETQDDFNFVKND